MFVLRELKYPKKACQIVEPVTWEILLIMRCLNFFFSWNVIQKRMVHDYETVELAERESERPW